MTAIENKKIEIGEKAQKKQLKQLRKSQKQVSLAIESFLVQIAGQLQDFGVLRQQDEEELQ